MISRESRENSLERNLSWRPLRCWIFAHLECPAMWFSFLVLDGGVWGFIEHAGRYVKRGFYCLKTMVYYIFSINSSFTIA